MAGANDNYGALITEDRYCPRCRYSLKGLAVGGVCPECGTTIVLPREGTRRKGEGPLADAPKAYLHILILASVGAGGGACLVLVTAMPFWSARFDPLSIGAIRLGAGVLWLASLAIMMRPRPTNLAQAERPRDELAPLRIVVLATQVFLVLAPASLVLGAASGVDALAEVSPIFFWIGMLGWPATGWYLGTIADWGNDFPLATRLKGSAWTIGAGYILVGVVWGIGWLDPGAGSFLSYIAFACVGFWLIARGVMVIGTFQIGGMVQWAMRNNERSLERDRTITERSREREAKRARAAGALGVPGPDPELLRSIEEANRHEPAQAAGTTDQEERPRPQASRFMHRIERGADSDPYAIEDG